MRDHMCSSKGFGLFFEMENFFEFRAEHFSMQLFRVGAKLTARPLSHQWS